MKLCALKTLLKLQNWLSWSVLLHRFTVFLVQKFTVFLVQILEHLFDAHKQGDWTLGFGVYMCNFYWFEYLLRK